MWEFVYSLIKTYRLIKSIFLDCNLLRGVVLLDQIIYAHLCTIDLQNKKIGELKRENEKLRILQQKNGHGIESSSKGDELNILQSKIMNPLEEISFVSSKNTCSSLHLCGPDFGIDFCENDCEF